MIELFNFMLLILGKLVEFLFGIQIGNYSFGNFLVSILVVSVLVSSLVIIFRNRDKK